MKKSTNTNHTTTLFAAFAGILLLTLTGCSTTHYGAANISSTPQGAEIINLKDNTNLGQTPAQVVWLGEDSQKVTVQFQKMGYHSSITSFWINRRHDSEAEARAQAIDVQVELEKE